MWLHIQERREKCQEDGAAVSHGRGRNERAQSWESLQKIQNRLSKIPSCVTPKLK